MAMFSMDGWRGAHVVVGCRILIKDKRLINSKFFFSPLNCFLYKIFFVLLFSTGFYR